MSVSNRAQRLIARQGLVIAVVLAIIGVGALGGAYYIYSSPTVETVTEQTNTQTIQSAVETSALVTGTNTTLYEQGRRLENMPVYFISATPNLTLTVTTSIGADGQVRVSQRLAVIQEATRNGVPFYSVNRTILSNQARTGEDEVTASTDLNTSAIQQRAGQVQNEIGTVGVFQTLIRLEIAYQTGDYEGTLSASAPLQITGGAYFLGSEIADSQTHSTPVTRRVTRPPDPTVYGGLAGAGILALLGAVSVAYYRRQVDIEGLSVEYSHEEYEEWISEGEFPTGTDKRYISINSLEDLVDIAIDSNKRVIWDSSLEVYSIVDGDLVYYFSTDPFSIDVWLDT